MEEKVVSNYRPSVKEVYAARERLNSVVNHTPLMENRSLSEYFQARIFLKREDLQTVRSYKIRGAYNKMKSLGKEDQQHGIVCASAGNHAQGVAYSCSLLKVHGQIFMPATTPNQKVTQVKMFGKEFVDVILEGDTFDDSYHKALEAAEKHQKIFIHPFNDPKVIEGQGTVGLEILNEIKEKVDYLFLPVGGGGLASGVGTIFKTLSPETKIIGVEPAGAPAMKESLNSGEVITLDSIDNFVDGAAVRKVGELTFEICREVLDEMVLVEEGKVCSTILKLYNEEAIVVEPAGALSIAVLEQFKDELVGKNVVCVLSGSNNDITRTEEIKERSLLFEGLKHYFVIRFAQRAGALQEFLSEVLGPGDDIVHFEYSKKNSREKGPALIGIEIKHKGDLESLFLRMREKNIVYEYLNNKPDLLQYLV